MKSFWNTTTILIAACAVLFPILNVLINYMYKIEGLGITNSLTICAIFITILSTLYSNYKNDLRINEQIKENEKLLFIQLRYDDAN